MAEMRHAQIFFDRLALQYAHAVPLGDFARANIKVVPIGDNPYDGFDQNMRHAFYKFSTEILAEKILSDVQEFTFEFPATWWQHWKQAHAGRWYARRIVRRWPVRMTAHRNAVSFAQYATYPLATVDVPPDEFGYPVVFETMHLTGPVEDGMTQVHQRNPRAVFVKRWAAERAVFERAYQASLEDSHSRFSSGHVHLVFDALEELGVNVNHLISKTAMLSRDVPVLEDD